MPNIKFSNLMNSFDMSYANSSYKAFEYYKIFYNLKDFRTSITYDKSKHSIIIICLAVFF